MKIMTEVTLYRKYLALDAVLKAVEKAGTTLSGNGNVDVKPYAYMRENLVNAATHVINNSGVSETEMFQVNFGSWYSMEISTFLDVWHGGSMRSRGEVLRSLMKSLPNSGIVVEKDGGRILIGIVHDVTFSLRIGVLAGGAR